MVLKLPFSFVFFRMPFVRTIVIPPFILKVIFSFSWGFSVSPAKTNLKSLAGWRNSQSKHQFSEKLLEKRKYLLSYVINPWCKILLHWKFLHMSYWCSFERYITAWRHLIIEILCSHWLKVKCCWSLNNDIQHCNINRSED